MPSLVNAIGVGFNSYPTGVGTPWYDGAEFNATDIADALTFGAAMVFQPANDRYAITTQSTANIPTASRADLAIKAACAFSDIVTCTRGTTATYVDVNGVIQTAAINTERFDYSTGARRLLSEEIATNLVVPSVPATSTWTFESGVVGTDNSGDLLDPSGGNSAAKMQVTADAAAHEIYSPPFSVTTSTLYTFSIFVHAGTTTRIQLTSGSSGFSANFYANFSLSGSGTVLAVGSDITASAITPIGNGWYRVSIAGLSIGTTTGARTLVTFIGSDTATKRQSYTGNGTDTVYVWGAHMEVGSNPSSYIPTTSSAVSRDRDYYRFTTKANALFARDPASWTIRGMLGASAFDRFILSNSDKFKRAIFTKFATRVASFDGTGDPLADAGSGTLLTGFGVSMASDMGVANKLCFNGGTIGSRTLGSSTTSGTWYLGSSNDTNGNVNGYFAELVVWPFFMTDTDITTKATPYV